MSAMYILSLNIKKIDEEIEKHSVPTCAFLHNKMDFQLKYFVQPSHWRVSSA